MKASTIGFLEKGSAFDEFEVRSFTVPGGNRFPFGPQLVLQNPSDRATRQLFAELDVAWHGKIRNPVDTPSTQACCRHGMTWANHAGHFQIVFTLFRGHGVHGNIRYGRMLPERV